MGEDRPRYQPIEDLEFYRDLERLGDELWSEVAGWRAFARDSVGLQLVRAIDSIEANLVEGDGRRSDAESLHFFSIAKGSAREARYWLARAARRTLITDDLAASYLSRLESIVRRLGALVTTRRRRALSTREPSRPYASDPPYDPTTLRPYDPF